MTNPTGPLSTAEAFAVDWPELYRGPESSPRPAPGKVTLTSRLSGPSGFRPAEPVQRREPAELTSPVDDPFGVHLLAAHGVAGPGAALPHLDTIQAAFGRHDVSGVRAHVGGAAAEAAAAIGAVAYATGTDVAFASGPDLHTAAHEAAHVVQQRGGVSLMGGVGAAGDAYERHADEVADAVVRGESVAALLDAGAGGGDRAGAGGGERAGAGGGERAGAGGGERAGAGGGDRGGAVQRKGSFADLVLGAVPAAQRFAFADLGEQRRTLRATPVAQRAALLATIRPGAARELLFAVDLPANERLATVAALPEVARGLTIAQAVPLFVQVHIPPGAQRRLFAALALGVRLQLFPTLSSRLQRDVYPAYNGATPAEHAALLSAVSDAELDDIFRERPSDAIQTLLEHVPRHLAARIVRAVEPSHPEVFLPEAHAPEEPRAATAKAPSLSTSTETWPTLPRAERADQFRAASVVRRTAYLRVEPASKLSMLRELTGAAFAETLAAYVSHGGASLLTLVTAEELLESILAGPPPAAVAQLVARLTPAQRSLILPTLAPEQVVAVLADRAHDRNRAWHQLRNAVPDVTLAAALRTIDDDALAELEISLDPGGSATLRALVSPERAALFAPHDD